ncbi:unnamed protein product [Cuscuta campestris]|uniref:Uncharacterized protein n=1 Tax=Cuscuta campestris TaxID=132261 RepID=A0A484KZ35_9ASTE|nr:unnamed protein product [Cuscuta campestris]
MVETPKHTLTREGVIVLYQSSVTVTVLQHLLYNIVRLFCLHSLCLVLSVAPLRRKKQHVILVEKKKQCVKDSAGTCCAFPTFHSVDGDSDSDVDPREMLIIVEETFQESLRVNKKKCLENDSLKRELAESKRDVEQLIKELQRYKGKVTTEDDTEDDT